MPTPDLEELKRIAEVEYSDIVKSANRFDYKLRIILASHGFIDVHLSRALPDKFGFHWECMDDGNTLYRYDNFPDQNWQRVTTYPYHFHNGSQDNVESAPFPLTVIEGFRAFLEFVRSKTK
jgi:phosphatidylserine/phosphatidylglycerophosphate/cardiolipin synthase-like enzyme